MAKNNLDVNINVKMNGQEALNEFSEIKTSISNVGNTVQKDFSQINKTTTTTGSNLKTAFTNGLSGVSEKVRSISESFSGLNGVMSSLMGTIGLGSFKSMTLDMAMTRDQAKNLLAVTMQGNSTFAEASQTAGAFIDKIKEGTSGSVVKLQMMIEAMNGIKLSTGMANSDLESLNDVIRKVGEASLLMGDDTEHATFVMKEAMSGLNGDFSVLKEQFGITADKMKEAGWSGAADDVQGYRAALEQCLSGLGDMGQVMDTTSGKINKIKSNFSSAGLEIGQQMLPAVDWIASSFLEANENGNILAKGILYAGGAASMFASLAPTLKPMFDTWDQMKGAVGKAKDAIKLLTDAEKLQETVTGTLDGLTAKLTGSEEAEAVAKTSEAAASGEAAAAQEAETVSKEAGALASDADALSQDADTVAKEANTVASGEAAAGNVTLAGALSASASSAWALTTALLANPLTWIAIAVIALVAVMWYLYNTNEEVRNSLNELGSMISGSLSGAWEALKGALIGFANAMQPVIMGLINFLKWIVLFFTDVPKARQQLEDFVTNGLNMVGDAILNALSGLWEAGTSAASDLVNGFISSLNNFGAMIQERLTTVKNIAGLLILMVVQSIVTRFNQIVARVRMIFSLVVNVVMTRLNQARAIATMLANAIRTAIVSRIQAMLNRVKSFFSTLVSNIRTKLSNAVSAARQKAVEIYNNIVNKIKEIPQAVSDEIGKIPDKIRDGLASAASAALTGAQNIVSNFLSGLQRASPGKIQRETVAEFTALPGIVMSQGALTAKAAGSAARGIVQSWADNMDTLGVNMDSVVPQFNALASEMALDLGVVGANMNGYNTMSRPAVTTNNNTSHNDNTNVYHVDHMTLDLNNLPTDEKEQWYNMLQTVARGV